MRLTKNPTRQVNQSHGVPFPKPWRLYWVRIVACLAATAALTGAGHPGQHVPSESAAKTAPVKDSNPQMPMRGQQTPQQKSGANNGENSTEAAAYSAMLLKMAIELKTEVDKTNKDMLSVTVVRKADALQKLAHQVKEKMKLSPGKG